MDLTAAEARVLGCLIERQVTAVEEHSVSLDELRFACNQTRGRHPVVAYDDRTVEDTLLSLKAKGLARFVLAGRTTGPVLYRHRADDRWRLSRPELAVLAVLLLRGPQTLRDVRSALADSPIPVDEPFDVEAVLDALAGRTPTPLARRVGTVAAGGEQRWSEALTAAGRRSALRPDDLTLPGMHAAPPPPPPPPPPVSAGVGPISGGPVTVPAVAAPGPDPADDGDWMEGPAGPGHTGRQSPGVAEPVQWDRAPGSAAPPARPSPTLADLADRLINIERRLAGIEAALGALRAAAAAGKPGAPSPPPSRAHR